MIRFRTSRYYHGDTWVGQLFILEESHEKYTDSGDRSVRLTIFFRDKPRYARLPFEIQIRPRKTKVTENGFEVYVYHIPKRKRLTGR